jgi:hypothetical protein
VFIHFEKLCGRASDRSLAADFPAMLREVFCPMIAPGMEQSGECSGLRIQAGEIWPFVQVAVVAGERKIFRRIAPFMLARDDVFDMKSQRLQGLRQPAVFTGVVRARPDELAELVVHHALA